ncbi:MAG TPA: LysR family transcriptional regulator [Burkholderiales bacterium]|nr:LysR family transcriptional regulator [Burkholderiales bacterium]
MAGTRTDWLARSRLNARQLALIVQLDEKRSVLKAAQAARMTQPAASKLLQAVEEALGVQLFARHSRGVMPTAYGEIVVRHARAALAEFRQAHEEVAALQSGVTGEVFLGTVVTSATDLVPAAVTRLKALHPRIRVNIELGFSEDMVRGLLDRKLDIAIARLHPSQALADLQFEALADEPHAMIARNRHPLGRSRRLAWRDLAQQTWVLPPPGNVLRDHLTRLFLEKGLALPQQVVETSSLPIITNLLRMSDMVAPLAIAVARPYCETGVLRVLPVRLDLRLGAAGILTRRDRDLSPGAAAMLKSLRDAAARLPSRKAKAG